MSLSKTREVVGPPITSTKSEAFFSFNMSQRYQIWIGKSLNSYRDDLLKVLGQNTAQNVQSTLPVDVRIKKKKKKRLLKLRPYWFNVFAVVVESIGGILKPNSQ